MAFVLLCLVLLAGVAWLWRAQSIQGTIVRLNTSGWKALYAIDQILAHESLGVDPQRAIHQAALQELRDQTRSDFRHAFELYILNINPQYDWLWRTNIKLFPTMVQVARGFQQLREIDLVVETYRVLANHIQESESAWLWDSYRTAIQQFLQYDFWSHNEREQLYQSLLRQDPKEWKLAEVELVRMTEIVGLWIHPMAKRFAEADLALYGTPRSLLSEHDANLAVDAELVYIIDGYPGLKSLTIPSQLSEAARKRIYWYSQIGAHCLIFANFDENDQFVLAGVEGVLLSEQHTVPEFNRAVELFEDAMELDTASIPSIDDPPFDTGLTAEDEED